jgi:hypothetical protein
MHGGDKDKAEKDNHLPMDQLQEQLKEVGGSNLFDVYDRHIAKLNELKDALKITGDTYDVEYHKAALTMREAVFAMGVSLFEKARTPLEKFQEQVSVLDQMLAKGEDRGGISQETYNRNLGQDAMNLLKTDTSQNIQAPKAVEAGSGEAYSAILKATRPETSVQERMVRILAQIAQHAATQERTGQELNRILSKPPITIKPV